MILVSPETRVRPAALALPPAAKGTEHASSERYWLGKLVAAWIASPATSRHSSEKVWCIECVTRCGVCPRKQPSSSLAKLATTICPPGWGSRSGSASESGSGSGSGLGLRLGLGLA
eukprot:scaffold15235_cov61-Phaeocystis_antarctica.AAC.4